MQNVASAKSMQINPSAWRPNTEEGSSLADFVSSVNESRTSSQTSFRVQNQRTVRQVQILSEAD